MALATTTQTLLYYGLLSRSGHTIIWRNTPDLLAIPDIPFRSTSQDSQEASRQVKENHAFQSQLCQATIRCVLEEGHGPFQSSKRGKFCCLHPRALRQIAKFTY